MAKRNNVHTVYKAVHGHVMCFSYGVVLWEILTRRIPYEGLEDGFIINQIVTGQLRLSVPESVPNVYKKLLLGKPTFNNNQHLLTAEATCYSCQ